MADLGYLNMFAHDIQNLASFYADLFQLDAPAELYMPKRKGVGRRPATSYRRFATAAEAIRFAVEEFPALKTLGACLQVGDQRYDSEEIRRLSESSGYPLRRAPS
jgi:hypothetical protein